MAKVRAIELGQLVNAKVSEIYPIKGLALLKADFIFMHLSEGGAARRTVALFNKTRLVPGPWPFGGMVLGLGVCLEVGRSGAGLWIAGRCS